jgi:hypothetical protein
MTGLTCCSSLTGHLVRWGMSDSGSPRNPCPADLAPPTGTLNAADLTAYLDLYHASDPAADLADPLGTLNFFDLAAYLQAFSAGCP